MNIEDYIKDGMAGGKALETLLEGKTEFEQGVATGVLAMFLGAMTTTSMITPLLDMVGETLSASKLVEGLGKGDLDQMINDAAKATENLKSGK